MPCKPSKARKLLKTNKAKVIQRKPFTIQLLYGSSGYKQEISLGVDTGSKLQVYLLQLKRKNYTLQQLNLETILLNSIPIENSIEKVDDLEIQDIENQDLIIEEKVKIGFHHL